MMIKRLILILGLTMAWAGLSYAQYAFPSEVTSKGSRILVDGETLPPSRQLNCSVDSVANRWGSSTLRTERATGLVRP